MKLIDRYILKQLLKPFFFGMFGFILIISIDPMVDSMKYVINNGVSAGIVLKWFLYRLPQDMVYTFPMAMLLSSLLCFGAMSGNSEIIAIKASGISAYRLVFPVMIFSLGASLACLAFSEIVIPPTNKESDRIRKEDILQIRTHPIKENIFTKTGHDSLMCAQRINLKDKTMRNVMIIHLGTDRKPARRIVAKSAVFKNESWTFYDVSVYRFDKGGASSLVKTYPEKQLKVYEKPEQFEDDQRKPKHMSMKLLRQKIAELSKSGSEPTIPYLVEYYLKSSIPFSTFVFAIIGVAMGFKPARTGAFVGFGISLLVIFAYYVAMSFCRSYGRMGFLPPPVAGWLQNFLFLAVGLWLLSKVDR
ncbi:MAG: hypothetical protein CVV64_02300 [Candidatus Wallbacteria bacterium HGW-Wallbacteria-1]|jgi:lipopolysaccharide export system permease protein|uniref:YjgP/YjgQ family permease n=1 Tax=Candidatus Wallbacteria bacterium HGW-Wallbacteria-1 TaxID=2013854 RepID=A0A2N1PV89_9BACT|nr:MAG: hypothetical protein CVV64_02300 [Candidatus Wallbacteria bacterium HGW-Wallbacteria-1]